MSTAGSAPGGASDGAAGGPAGGRDTHVVVVGAGPVGLMLAGELRLGGAEVIVLERRATRTTESRATTLHARTMEILDSRGLLEAVGTPPNEPRGHFGGIPMDLTLPGRYPGQWKVPQTRTEELLQDWAVSLGVDLRRDWELLDLADTGDHVAVTAGTPHGVRWLRAEYLVACDGEESTVRRLTGVPFPGRSAQRELLRADVSGIDIPGRRFQRLERGLAIAARNPQGVTRVMVHEFGRPAKERTADPEFAEVVEVWRRVTGEDIGHGTPLWVNSFGDANRQLASYRHGRVLFAGDAAHQKMPSGGQALNLGLQDAVNLGWKLAATVRGRAPEALLDSYHEERHAVGRRVLANIEVQALLLLGGAEVTPFRTLLADLIATGGTRADLAGMVSGLDIGYLMDVPEDRPAHPLLGRRLPDLTLATPRGTVRAAELLRTGQGLLLDLAAGRAGRAADEGWAEAFEADEFVRDVVRDTVREAVRKAVRTVAADDGVAGGSDGGSAGGADGGSPFRGTGAVLVRPDGYIAWTGPRAADAEGAIRRWFAPPVRESATAP